MKYIKAKAILWIICLTIGIQLNAQKSPYQFKDIIDIKAAEVPNQGQTGTCWSFSTASFLESEVLRITGKMIDLSEMYWVRTTYPLKAYNYVYRQGKANYSEGALSHDVTNAARMYGAVPNDVYDGRIFEKAPYNHKELVETSSKFLKQLVDNPKENLKEDWMQTYNQILDKYIGEIPKIFEYNGEKHTPESFWKKYGVDTNDYVELASTTHFPYYSEFIMSIPDNFSNGSYINIPMDEMMNVLDNALKKGLTVALDIDVSEKTFSAQQGIAIWPENPNDKNLFKEIITEKKVTAKEREAAFENFSTTDDHLMHIVGMAKDQNGNTYYKVKNSWGQKLGNGGYVYISRPYMEMKTIAIMVHKDVVSKKILDVMK